MNKEQNFNNSDNVIKRFWLYKPKYNERYDNVDENTKNEILKTEGGIWQIYDHEPSEDEIKEAFFECYL